MNSPFPISAEQQSMLYMESVLGISVLRNVLVELPLARHVEYNIVERALAQISHTHEALRAAQPNPRNMELSITDALIALDPHSMSDGLDDCRLRLRLRRDGRHVGPRGYSEIHQGEGGRALLLAAFDHLVCDGGSREILLRDLIHLTSGLEITGSGLTLQQYCLEQRQLLANRDTLAAEGHAWSKALAGTTPLTGLASHIGDRSTWRAIQSLGFWPGATAYRTVRHLVAATRSTPFAVVAALLTVVIWQRTGIRSSALVTPISNRRSAAQKNLVGNLVNERPISYRLTPDMPLKELIQNLGQSSLEAMRCSLAPIPYLVQQVPEFQSFFGASGSDYVQLQVTLADHGAPGEPSSRAGFGPELDSGPYLPTEDVTCTVIRVSITPSGLGISVFHGGPSGGAGAMIATAMTLADLITGAESHHPDMILSRLKPPA